MFLLMVVNILLGIETNRMQIYASLGLLFSGFG